MDNSITDPRLSNEPIDNIMPVVANNSKQSSVLLIAVPMIIAGALLFNALESKRQKELIPVIKPPVTISKEMAEKYPDLYIPQFEEEVINPVVPAYWNIKEENTSSKKEETITENNNKNNTQNFVPSPQVVYVPQPMPNNYNYPINPPQVSVQPPTPPVQTYQRSTNISSLIFDRFAENNDQKNQNSENAAQKKALTSQATYLRNKDKTILQGTLIPAVLETALDSNRPGQIRAVVTRDLRGFDGALVIIPRGSKLIGEFQADIKPNQKRAFVLWTRLIRPDGVSISLESPSSDTIGSIGISGIVDTHFFERFSSAVFRSTLEAGVGLASRRNNTSIIISPNSVGQTINTNSTQSLPTLKVKQGAIITVMVARDLDFSNVDSGK